MHELIGKEPHELVIVSLRIIHLGNGDVQGGSELGPLRCAAHEDHCCEPLSRRRWARGSANCIDWMLNGHRITHVAEDS